MDSIIIQHAIREYLGEIHLNVLEQACRGRSDSRSHHHSSPKVKDYDLVSLTTVAATLRSQGSAKKMDEFSPDRQSNNSNHNRNSENQNSSQKESDEEMHCSATTKCKMSKNGALLCPSKDISNLKYYFIKAANDKQALRNSSQMTIMRDLDNIVTAKSTKGQTATCFLRLCFPFGWDRSVYQLERSFTAKGSRVRVVLVSGVIRPSKQKQLEFQAFKRQFHYELWQNGFLEINDKEAIRLCCSLDQEPIALTKKTYEKAYAQCEIFNLDSAEEIQKWDLALMNVFKQAQRKVHSSVFEGLKRVPKVRENLDYFHQYFMSLTPVQEFYIKSKLSQNKKIDEIRKQVQTSLTIAEIFQFLQVEQKFQPFIKNYKTKTLFQLIQEDQMPFFTAVRYLEDLTFGVSPFKNIQAISGFTGSLVADYKSVCEWEEPVLDMDNQLPLTIYCILGCRNPQLKALVCLCANYLQFEDTCENEKRTLAALNASLDFIYGEWPSKIQERSE